MVLFLLGALAGSILTLAAEFLVMAALSQPVEGENE